MFDDPRAAVNGDGKRIDFLVFDRSSGRLVHTHHTHLSMDTTLRTADACEGRALENAVRNTGLSASRLRVVRAPEHPLMGFEVFELHANGAGVVVQTQRPPARSSSRLDHQIKSTTKGDSDGTR